MNWMKESAAEDAFDDDDDGPQGINRVSGADAIRTTDLAPPFVREPVVFIFIFEFVG